MNFQAKTLRGRNILAKVTRALGHPPGWWALVTIAERIQASPEPGPWALVAPEGDRDQARWIHTTNDLDFQETLT
jgi:hypothetical protein